MIGLLLTLSLAHADDKGVIIHLGGQVQSADAAAQVRLPPLPSTPVSLDVVEADLSGLMRLMAQVGDLNIILADGVSGQVTVQVEDRPWDETLVMILAASGHKATRMGEKLILVEPLGG
ncbi:MAG: hypothetical protein H6741_18505 [Alphaproteobacteria bacterium]|nr:hypothetical protein [Alphaproteobacteria bacterium]MCB9794708.1 hypothetical protein [Alphaproteobacteria bacterium]